MFEKENNKVFWYISVKRVNNEKCILSVFWSLKLLVLYCGYVKNVRRLVFIKEYFNWVLI